jgi:nicotinic acid phosphoribosyltransferase
MNPECGALLTDLYELTMLQGYWQHAMYETAVFEIFCPRATEAAQFPRCCWAPTDNRIS